jgi:hypothetical protein
MKLSLFALTLTVLSLSSAHAGDKVLNGGDACEARFLEVRNDLASWIQQGGYQELKLPSGVTMVQYQSEMTKAIQHAQVSCTNDPLALQSVEKTCLNSIDSRGNSAIRCNRTAFLALSQDDQYRLVHHEYAGLAGLEANTTPASQYPISKQLTDFLDSTVMKKLAVKSEAGSLAVLQRQYGDFIGSYDVANCAYNGVALDPNEMPDLCQLTKLTLKYFKDSDRKASILLHFDAAKDPKLPNYGMTVGYSKCQLSYGTTFCEIPPEVQGNRYITSRIEKMGDTYFFTISIIGLDASVQQWSLVLNRTK